MPAVAAEYNIGNRSVNESGDEERKARVVAYNKAREYYFGNHAKQIKVKPGQPDVNVTFNLVQRAIDAMVAFMGVPRFEVAGGVEREPDAAGLLVVQEVPEQQAINALWEMNNLPLLLVDAALSAALGGHGYLRLIAGVDLPGVGLLDPRYVTVFWDMEDVRRVLWYRLDWRRGKADRRQDIVRGELIGTTGWEIIEYERADGLDTEWREVGRDRWPWEFPPIVDWKNAPNPHEFYGRDEVLAAAALNDAANFVGSNINKILKHHAGPKTVITGGKAPAQPDSAPDAILEIPSADAKVFNLEMQGDLNAAMEFFHLLRASFFEQTRVVDKSGIREKLGNLTNFGLRVMYGDQVDAVQVKRRLIGQALVEVSRRALAMMGMSATDVAIVWDDPLPVNRLEVVQAVAIEHGIGATSQQSLLESMGRDPAVESERRGDEVNRAGDLLADTLVGLGQRGLM